ncbi:hypothetical protein ACIA8R_13055 [Nonomuraea sp. NPDC051191]|uniref:hypothetical protein n=1 Tax=Nonomuraea sp. NPDC051191 TaxID=3364372 RepID=UPI0037A66303
MPEPAVPRTTSTDMDDPGESLRGRVAAGLLVLAVVVVAAALVGGLGHYVVLDRPVLLGTVAASLVIVSGALAFGAGPRGPAVALVMIWATVGLVGLVSVVRVHSTIPGPDGSGLEVRVLYDDWIVPDWTLVVRRKDGPLTREWPLVERFTTEYDDGLPRVTWLDPAHVRLDDRPGDDRGLWGGQTITLDPRSGRPLVPGRLGGG